MKFEAKHAYFKTPKNVWEFQEPLPHTSKKAPTMATSPFQELTGKLAWPRCI